MIGRPRALREYYFARHNECSDRFAISIAARRKTLIGSLVVAMAETLAIASTAQAGQWAPNHSRRIIHARRNPVDTCLSCYRKLFAGDQPFAYELTEFGEYYRYYERLIAHWRSVLPAGRFIEVDYEAVVDDLEGEARRLVNFLDLPWDDACLRFHENRRVVRTASLNQVPQPIYRSSKGRWKPYEAYLGPLLEALDSTG
ncbi:hypothetical protein OKW45_004570 [Paraburkholderia sp. WSM4175]